MIRIPLFVTVIAIAGCGSAQVNPAKMQPLFENASPRNYSAGAKFVKPLPWAVGQWVKLGTIEKGVRKSVMKLSVVGKAEGGFIFEMQVIDSQRENVMQYLMRGVEQAQKTGKPADIEIVWIKIRDEEGNIQKLDGPMMRMYRSMVPDMADSVRTVNTFTNGGTVTVPAGTFYATNMVKSESRTLGFSSKSTGYFHSSVPINGLVKTSTENDETQVVLIAFGTSGAKPLIKLGSP